MNSRIRRHTQPTPQSRALWLPTVLFTLMFLVSVPCKAAWQTGGTNYTTYQQAVAASSCGGQTGCTFLGIASAPIGPCGSLCNATTLWANKQVLTGGTIFYFSFGIGAVNCPGGTVADIGSPTGCSPPNGTQPRKANGSPRACPGGVGCGDPINIGTGNVFEQVTDYEDATWNHFGFTRYYNSRTGFTGMLGMNWRSNYERFVNVLSSTSVLAERPDGQQLTFNLVGGIWTPDTDVDYKLTQSGTTWTLTGPGDNVETYTASLGNQPLLSTIATRSGYTLTLAYTNRQISSVTDSYGRALTFTYTNGLVTSMGTPESTTISYGYNNSNGPTAQLITVTFPTSPASTLTYGYAANSAPATALTSITDENGSAYAGWTYDTNARGLTSALGGTLSASLTTVAYNDSNGTRTVTNALGVTDTYTFTTLQGVPKVTQISRAATTTTAAATESFTYDSNGYPASATDWNGIQTTYTNNSHGRPLTINEAVGTSVARTTTIVYDTTWQHLPQSIATPGLTVSFTYDGSGELLTKTLTDTTTTSQPYSTNGQTRTWTYTWANGVPATAKSPNLNTTTFTFSGNGALTNIANALSQNLQITSYSGGGLPLTVVDPNGVTTTLAYDARQRLLSSSVATTGGARTTTYGYDAAGNLTSVTLPDNSKLTNTYDAAHRLTGISDLLSNTLTITLDALGDTTQALWKDATPTTRRQHSATFDALGRVLHDIGGVSQTTAFAYDANGNALTITDPRNHATTNTVDALNRLSTRTDANAGIVRFTYDAHNRPLTGTDANNNATSYVYDGFGDLIQVASPDSGTTKFWYDSDGNRMTAVDANGNATRYTYDALDRVLTTTYPTTSLNVAYTYDQTGHGKGIGRLTSLTDASGSLSRTYDERGNIQTEQRVNGTNTLTTTYTYDAASRIASITYPSGALVSYTRDSMGNVTKMPFSATNSDEAYGPFTVTHLPFGPFNSIRWNNGDQSNYTYDLDYRLTTLVHQNFQSVPYVNWTYGYDNANNVTSITDNITSANSQTLGYDLINRLISASSTGTYGSISWSYDKNGNLTGQTRGGVAYTYTYQTTSNRIVSGSWPGTSQSWSYTATGNVSNIAQNGSNVVVPTYDTSNRLNGMTGSALPLAIASATYDAFGKRITKQNPGSNPNLYTYDLAGNLIEENDGGFITDYLYLDGVNVGNWEPSQKHLYMINTDRLGVPMVSRDEYGLTNWAAYSDPQGIMAVTVSNGQFTGPITQNLRLPGQYWDHEIGFHYNGFRDENPFFGRYLEPDPIGLSGGMNAYAYANGNPGAFIDRKGLQYRPYPVSEAEQRVLPETPEDRIEERINERYEQFSAMGDGLDLVNQAVDYIDEHNQQAPEPERFALNLTNLPPTLQQALENELRRRAQLNNSNGTSCYAPGTLVPEHARPLRESHVRYAVQYWSDNDDYVHLGLVDYAELQRLIRSGQLLNH